MMFEQNPNLPESQDLFERRFSEIFAVSEMNEYEQIYYLVDISAQDSDQLAQISTNWRE